MALSRVLVVLGAIGFFLALLGGAGVIFLPRLFTSLLDKKLPLVNNSVAFNLWQDIPLPIYRKFYFFNLTNPTEFVVNKAKPKLVEVGPYSYRVTWIKKNITWNSNGTISYREVKTYFFDRNSSIGAENDTITSINIPLVSSGALVDKIKNPLERRIVAYFINRLHEKLVVQHKVSELLFDGYVDELIKESRVIDPTIPDTKGKFGLMVQRNGSNDGLFTVYTGKGEMDKYNVITRWNGLQNLTWWNGACGMINGTNGELVPPLGPGQNSIYVFNPDFCRSFKMISNGPVSKMGIKLEQFVAPKTTFLNGDNYSSNACFDTKHHLRSGVMDLGPCQHGAPAALSFPHFYMADPYYLEQVEGLQPNSTLHRFLLDLEPKLGLTLGLRGRIQLNIVVKKNRLIKSLADIPELVYPFLWEEIHVEMDDALANYLKTTMEDPIFYSMLFAYLLLSLGGLLFLTAVACILGKALAGLFNPQDAENKSLIVDDDEGVEDAATKDLQNHEEVIT
ncbi:scavenger receptor class B member 1-like [Amblyomma americanum]